MRKRCNYSRRRAMQTLGVGTIAAVAGCMGASDESPPDESDGETEEESSEFRRGGTLRMGTDRSFSTLNGLISSSGSEQMLNGFLHAYLVGVNPDDLSISPQLATDWESNEDNTQWTFELRDDFTFHHDHSQVLAEDVAATANAIVAEESAASGKANLGPIEEAEVLDDATVQFNLNQPDGNIPTRWGIAWAPIYPKDVVEGDWDDMGTNDFGAGPFQVESFDPGNEIVLSVYDDYPITDDNGESLPYLDGVTVELQPDASTMVTNFLGGDFDLLRMLPFSQIGRVESEDGVEAMHTDVASFPVIQMWSTEPPFDDNRVRTAFKLAVNREDILLGALDGRGTIGNDHPVGPGYAARTELPEQRTQDLEEAERLLEEAGFGEGGEEISLELKAPNNPDYVLDTSVIAAEHINNLPNVEIEVVQQSYDAWISETWLNSQFYTSWYGQEILAILQLEIVWHSEGSWNEANWGDDEFDEALENAISTADDDAHREYIQECQQILYERGPSIIPVFRNMVSGRQEYVHGFVPSKEETLVDLTEVWLDENAPTHD